jgi:hypothetical protein
MALRVLSLHSEIYATESVACLIKKMNKDEAFLAEELMQILIERGYFHDGIEPVQSSDVDLHSDFPTFGIENSSIVRTSSGTFVTLERLCLDFWEYFEKRARELCTYDEAAMALHVAVRDLRRTLDNTVRSSKTASLLVINDHYLTTAKRIDDMLDESLSLLDSNFGGRALVSELVGKSFHLPLSNFLQLLEDRRRCLPYDVELRLQDNGSKTLVTQRYLALLRSQISSAFADFTEPTSLVSVARRHSWEVCWMSDILKDIAQELPGALHGDDSYVPHSFTQQKHQTVTDSFASNGFVSTTLCQTVAMLPSELKRIVASSCSEAIILENSVVHPLMIVGPLEGATQDSIEIDGWLDLQQYIPAELLAYESDTKALLQNCILSKLDEGSRGVAAISKLAAVFVSQGMIAKISNSVLPLMIEPFAKERAKALESQQGQSGIASTKSKRKSKKNLEALSSDRTGLPSDTIPSMADIVTLVLNTYPDISDWVRETGAMGKAVLEEAFCSCVTEEFRALCEKSVQAELRLLRSSRITRTSASMTQSMEGAFEDPQCFATSCYVIQMASKLLQYLAKREVQAEAVNAMRQDILRGPCADFCRRLTEYCLLKNEIVEGIFSFDADSVESHSAAELPHCCLAVDTSRRRYFRTHLTCHPDAQGKPRDPLPTLRTTLPGSIGMALTHLWILCGGDCYQGGTKNGQPSPPGNFDAFSSHAEENCLTICGLPFKKLDKKSEKQFLFDRRLRLSQQLKDSIDPEVVLELTTMLLYQSIKNLFVFGESVQKSLLNMLVTERKVSDEVATGLKTLATCISVGNVDTENMNQVREFGLSRYGSK